MWWIYWINWLSYHVNKDDGNIRTDAEEAEEHCLAYEYRSRNRHQTCELNNMSPANGVRFGSYTEDKLCCYLHNWCGKGWPMVIYLFRAPVVLYKLLSLINVYEMINTWNSLIAYIII